MITRSEFFASEQAKKLPTWIKDSPYWTTEIKKVYPDLGLENCREPCEELITPLVPYENNAPVPAKAPTPVKMDVCFSSDGVEGLWDILTMSMRGVSSCKHWENTTHSKTVVSTAVNPAVGIIYLTDGTMTKYGPTINRRALVYYSGNESWAGAMPSRISIDRVYTKSTNTDPFVYLNVDPDAVRIKTIFKNFLKSRLSKSNLKKNIVVE